MHSIDYDEEGRNGKDEMKELKHEMRARAMERTCERRDPIKRGPSRTDHVCVLRSQL